MKKSGKKKALAPEQLLTLRHAVPMWIITENLPGSASRYVAKLFVLSAGGTPLPTREEIQCGNLDNLRAQFQGGTLDPVPRMPGDPPNLVEKWL